VSLLGSSASVLKDDKTSEQAATIVISNEPADGTRRVPTTKDALIS
jgi:hypothetical protein